MIPVAVFLAGATLVVIAGTALARYAEAIAEATRLGRLWIGAVLLAGATSLPELTTDIFAVRMGAADLAVGDLFGSSLANMLILAVIGLVPRKQVLQKAAYDHALAASLAISLNALAAALVLVRPDTTVLWIGPGSLVILLAYVAGTRVIYRHTASLPATRAESLPPPPRPGRSVLGFVIATLVILAAAPAFAWSAKSIAEITGLGNTFVGTWFVGLATSLPELVACLAAVKLGAFDLAIGNLFGSNAFNMAILFVLDAVQPGSLFAVLDPSHAISALFGVVLMSLGLAAIVYRAKRRFAMIEPDSFLILAVYATAVWILYQQVS